MKKMYRYFLVGKNFIVRSYAWKVNNDIIHQYYEVSKELFDRAEKYSFVRVALD